ncbi:hypothetical protein MMC11_005602 [Xylographa trunciseda]|nr:hypothetical protein [Xylographa trunciseda]
MSACIWSTSPGLRSKVALSHIWPECEQFFRLSLQVKDATLKTIVDEIKQTSWGSDTNDVNVTKSLFATLQGFVHNYSAGAKIEGLMRTACLPIRNSISDSHILWTTSDGTFFIADREYLQNSFAGKVPTLEFSVDEAYKFRDIFKLLNLSSKHLSNIVKEDNEISASRELDPRLTAKFRSKTVALIRCAQHWSPMEMKQEILQRRSELNDLEVFRVSKITLRRYLSHQGQIISVDSEADLYFTRSANRLLVYLPAEEARLQLVYQLDLPEQFAKFLGIDECSIVISAILRSEEAAIDSLLDRKGIPKLQGE